VRVEGTPHLIIPYTLEVNDMKFAVPPGFGLADGWLQAMKDTFDLLYAEGARHPKMMSAGIHCRLGGRPSRAMTLARFLDYVASKPKVWVATRRQIAEHWKKVHPAHA
jgi:peptidoglycan/xylan/chitin deacetylase (PgdA/CDA1 family)